MNDVLERAERWAKQDIDGHTRAELERLVERARGGDAEATAQLTDRFVGPLEFGTAGLRGVIGAGESRMNRSVVVRTTLGFARYLAAHAGDAARAHGVVIGYDGRIMSREFAEDTAGVLAAEGVTVHLCSTVCPTPFAAYAVTALGAAGGVMITASHNPPEYNGYKVYWSNGAQIIPPHDHGIAAAIAACPPANEVRLLSVDEARARGHLRAIPDSIEARYLGAVRALSVRSDGDRTLPIVYTPLHGVGHRLVRKTLEGAGFGSVHTVAEQAEPDGAFPTVAFPNPEEKGALDLALALADRVQAEIVIANDPDVDRLAVAVRSGAGRFVQLTGNQVGVLLGHYLLTEGRDQGAERLVLASCVSSPMLGMIARELGVRYEETLTGFKWIANRAMELEQTAGARFVFGYEEALGYTAGDVVRDKDGISAAMLIAELAAVLRAGGHTLLDRLDELARRYGLYVSGQRSLTLPGADGVARAAAIMKRLRAAPPRAIGGVPVAAVVDYLASTRARSGSKPEPLGLPSSNVLAFELDGGSRIMARPSGTEPKIKFYFDVREPVGPGEPIGDADARARTRMQELMTAFGHLAGID